MTHNEIRTYWLKEGAIGLGVGVLYGVTNVAVGHPFDTVKTKMQAQKGFVSSGMFQTFVQTFKTQGIRGLYRGCIPPLWGSGIFRATQFAVFEAGYTYLGAHDKYGVWTASIPGTAGLQTRVVLAGVVASTARAIIETPLEYAKISGQTQQKWNFAKLYTGFGVTWVRTIGLMTSYFIFIDSGRRHFPEKFNSPLLGPFLASGIAATVAWWLVWPFEFMKSQVQGRYGNTKLSVLKRMEIIFRGKGGFFGLYRGIIPGSIRSFLANGCAMIVMANAQKKVSDLGLRKEIRKAAIDEMES